MLRLTCQSMIAMDRNQCAEEMNGKHSSPSFGASEIGMQIGVCDMKLSNKYLTVQGECLFCAIGAKRVMVAVSCEIIGYRRSSLAPLLVAVLGLEFQDEKEGY